MNRIIKLHILSLCLIFGLSSTIEAMERQPEPKPIETKKDEKMTPMQIKLAAQWVVFKETVNRGFSWLMERINQFFSQIQKPPTTPTPQTTTLTTQTPSHKITAQKFNSWHNIRDAIYFYDMNKDFYLFTNFSEYPYDDSDNRYKPVDTYYQFKLDGKKWKTVEQYYQANKFTDQKVKEKVRLFISDRSGSAARKALAFATEQGQKRPSPIRQDWRQISIQTMLNAVRAKFKETELYKKLQKPSLRAVLLDTGDKILVEDSEDSFYGRGNDWKGTNHLGRILMHVRDEIREEIKLHKKVEMNYDHRASHDIKRW